MRCGTVFSLAEILRNVAEDIRTVWATGEEGHHRKREFNVNSKKKRTRTTEYYQNVILIQQLADQIPVISR